MTPGPVGVPEQQAEDGQQQRDRPGLPDQPLDGRLQHETYQSGRNRAEQQQPGQPPVRIAPRLRRCGLRPAPLGPAAASHARSRPATRKRCRGGAPRRRPGRAAPSPAARAPGSDGPSSRSAETRSGPAPDRARQLERRPRALPRIGSPQDDSRRPATRSPRSRRGRPSLSPRAPRPGGSDTPPLYSGRLAALERREVHFPATPP